MPSLLVEWGGPAPLLCELNLLGHPCGVGWMSEIYSNRWPTDPETNLPDGIFPKHLRTSGGGAKTTESIQSKTWETHSERALPKIRSI